MYFVKLIDLPKIGKKFFFTTEQKLNEFLFNLPKKYEITEYVEVEEEGVKVMRDVVIDTMKGAELKKYYEDNIYIAKIDIQKCPNYEMMFRASLHPSCLPNPS